MFLRLLFIVLIGYGNPSKATCIGLGCTCTVAATSVAFGNYSPLTGSSLSSNGNIAVTCSALVAGLNVSYVIALSAGTYGTYAARRMSNGATTLQYNLSSAATGTPIWGDGTAGTSTVSDAYLLSLLSVTRNYTVYGALPGAQNVPPGSYTDTITVTVTY